MKRVIEPAVALLVALCVVATSPATAKPPTKAKKTEVKKTEAKPVEVKKAETKAEPEAEKPTATKAAEKDSDTKKSSTTKPTHHKVKKGPLKIEVSLDGHFQAARAHEVKLRLKAWTSLEVVKAVKHGARVKRGETLVTLDMEKIDEAIAAAKNEQQSAKVGLLLATADLRLLEAALPLEKTATERNHKRSGEDFARYYAIDLPLMTKAAELSLKMTEEYLENQREELRQLEKMYKADDLTEETEEIILKRQRSAVKRAEYMFERAKAEHAETMKIMLPRRDEDMKDRAQIEQLQYRRATTAIPLLLDRAKAELEKAKIAQAKVDEKLKQLMADRKAMVVKAPAEGILYYGQASRGKFSGSEGNPLKRGDSISANKVFMTIVQPRPLSICVDVAEDKLHAIRTGMKATAKPKAYPDLKVPAKVTEVDAIPAGEGKFRARLSAAPGKDAAAIMPGMACSVKLVPYLKADALTVPKAAVETDELDDEKHFVYLVVKKGGKPKKQPVKLGKKTEKVVEIVEGLTAGVEILSEPPKKD